jgi:hypothetical protein
MELMLGSVLSGSTGDGGVLSLHAYGIQALDALIGTRKGRMVDLHGRGELDQVVIHPRAEEVQAPKQDMGAPSEANTIFGHPKPDKVDRDEQKAPT